MTQQTQLNNQVKKPPVVSGNLIAKLILWIILACVLIFILAFFFIERDRINGTLLSLKLPYTKEGAWIDAEGWSTFSVKDWNTLMQTKVLITWKDGAMSYVKIDDMDVQYIAKFFMEGSNGTGIVYKTNGGEIFNYGVIYPLMDFSLMNFFKTNQVNPLTAWMSKNTNMTVVYAYVFVSSVMAVIFVVLESLLIAQEVVARKKMIKYHFSFDNYDTYLLNYRILNTRNWSGLVCDLTILFCFFNFVSTLAIIAYSIVAIIIFVLIGATTKNKTFTGKNAWKLVWGENANVVFFIAVMFIQNGYNLLKAVLLSTIDINLDVVFSVIIPIGLITVILGFYIKSAFDSQITQVKKAIKNIDGQVTTFRTFYNANPTTCIDDYNFVNSLPAFLKKVLNHKDMNKKILQENFELINKSIDFFNTNYDPKSQTRKVNLYAIFNVVKNTKQLQALYNNGVKAFEIETENKAKKDKGALSKVKKAANKVKSL